MNQADFIEVFPDALSADACARLIARFEASGSASPGRTAEGVKPEHKDSRDITGFDHPILADLVAGLLRPGTINLQHYRADSGGYPAWHCEIALADPRAEFLHRALLWTIYLNDGFEAGETEFMFQQRKVRPETGSLLIAPTAFTHTHRGNRPGGGDKYIATSWVLFKRYEHFTGAKP